jgi:pyrimidine-nucleoside phosphorylase
MLPHWLIEKKRNGEALSGQEIRFFIDGFSSGAIPDYQMSAMAMAIFFREMTGEETLALTEAMMNSGDVVDTSSIQAPKADKHSTGGIGDKVSLILAPLVACFDIAVPMISGRGLGITGGTLDKLESIPGYRTDLVEKEFISVLNRCGCSIIGQTSSLAPADKKLYALRDVTATVPSIPLIVASIMSKKLAEGIDSLVMDVKCGRGAFMQSREDARQLARNLVDVGLGMNKNMAAIITDMNQPLGRTAGNALEVAESAECLRGEGAEDLMEVTYALCARMLLLSGKAMEKEEAIEKLREKIDNGEAFEKFLEMVRAQGGDEGAIEDTGRLPAADIREPYPSTESGFISDVNAELIGRACIVLGAGRQKTTDLIDPAVGVSGIPKIGEPVTAGEPLLIIHANEPEKLDAARQYLKDAFEISDRPVSSPLLILEEIIPKPPQRAGGP